MQSPGPKLSSEIYRTFLRHPSSFILHPSMISQFSILASALSDDPRQAPRIARRFGFAGLLFDAESPALNIADLSVSGRREFRHVLSADDRQLVGLRADLGPRGFGPGADVDRALARLARMMDAAAGLQAPLLCLDLGPLPIPPRQATPKPKIRPEEAGIIIIPSPLEAAPASQGAQLPEIPAAVDPNFPIQVDAALRELGRLADRTSVTIAMRSDLAGFAAIERALTAANCPWFGVDLDPVAILRDEWEMDEIFSRMGSLVRHVRARDALCGADRRTKPAVIAAGNIEWGRLLANLDRAGCHGWITIDPLELPDRLRSAAEGLAQLRKLTRHEP